MLTEQICKDLKDIIINYGFNNSVIIRFNTENCSIFRDFVVKNPGYYGKLIGLFDIDDHILSNEIEIVGNLRNGLTYKIIHELTSNKTEYGVTCSKCNQFYPYQIKQKNFKCWGCRHGY